MLETMQVKSRLAVLFSLFPGENIWISLKFLESRFQHQFRKGFRPNPAGLLGDPRQLLLLVLSEFN